LAVNPTNESVTATTNVTLADQVLQAIQKAIVNGELAPGSKLNEPDLARQYGISRGPLREAIRRLEARQLVQLRPHTGARVTRLSVDQLLDIYYLREALEGMACRLAAERVSPAEVDGLKRLLETHGSTVTETEGRAYFQQEGDLDFHYRLAMASGSQMIQRVLCVDLYHLMRMYRYQSSLFPDRPQAALKEHWRIIDAIAEGDGELAELLMRRHIRAVRERVRDMHVEDVAIETERESSK
jgi:DNA-binding GntR family transcriptional regulator